MGASVTALDPALPVEMGALERHVDSFLQRPRFTTSVLCVFGVVALLLAVVGLYGVLSHTVVERTREIGVRMALGARAASVVRAVMSRAMTAVAIGVACGVVGSLVAGRLLRGMLFGIGAHDPRLLAAATSVFCCVAIAAAWIPARKATRVDPSVALRHD